MKSIYSKAVIFFAVVFAVSAMLFFTSCQSVRSMERNGCYATKMLSGYSTGNTPKAKFTKRNSY